MKKQKIISDNLSNCAKSCYLVHALRLYNSLNYINDLRFSAEEALETARLDFESAIRKKEELSQELDDAYVKNESLEHRLQMMSGKYEDVHGEVIYLFQYALPFFF